MPGKALKVKLMLRAKNQNGQWRYFSPGNKEGKRSPYTPLCAMVGKEPKLCPEGVYYLRYVEDKTPKFVKARDEMTSAGKTPNENPTPVEALNQALAALTICQRRLGAKAVGLEIVSQTPIDVHMKDVPGTEHSLKKSATDYLNFVFKHCKHATYRAYSIAVNGFKEYCKKPTLESVEEKDILGFGQYLKKERNSSRRTVSNRVKSLKTFFLYYKVPWPVERHHMPKFTQRTPTAYDPADVLKLAQFGTLDEAEWAAFMVGTGVREKEAEYACWTDFDFASRAYRVCEKLDFPKFEIKDSEERIIPINDELVTIMKARKKRYPGSRLVFPTAKGKPEGHMLRIVKNMAFKGGLNCGHCQAKDGNSKEVKSCREYPVCRKWTLHDFRRTYATRLYAEKTPIDVIQKYLGHADIQTTLRYLKASNVQDEKTWKAVNAALPGLLAITNTKS